MAVGIAIWLILCVVAGALLCAGLILLVVAPMLASRVASTTSRPRLAKRASGPDRMRGLIAAQRSARQKRSSLQTAMTRSGVVLLGAAAASLVAAGILALTGAGS